MKALIVRGSDRHTVRLQQGLLSCGIVSRIVTKPEEFTTHRYDFVFVDPSFDYDLKGVLQCSDKLFFFDSEDDPRHFDPKAAYYTLKDSVLAYAKMNYVEDDRVDGIKNIGFPLSCFLPLSNFAHEDYPRSQKFIPFMVAHPTYLGRYTPLSNSNYVSSEDISCFGNFEGVIMYNQRYDWLLSLQKNNIPYVGGIVFQNGNNLSLEFQGKYFGNVARLRTNPVSYRDQLLGIAFNNLSLCPTGHERISWRTYDTMATGSILIRTDHKKQMSLINPKEYITIDDGADLGSELIKLEPHYKELLHQHQANREIFKKLSPHKLITLFLDQLR